MRAPQNRRVFVVGYEIASALGSTFAATWDKAVKGETGFRKITRCRTGSRSNVVGEIPDWNPRELDFIDRKDAANWTAGYVFLTMVLCKRALENAGITSLRSIGDCRAPGTIAHAVYSGHECARNIDGGDSTELFARERPSLSLSV